MAHIAVVDNYKPALSSLSERLRHFGHLVDTASSVDEAWQIARTRTPDVWLIDIRLRDNRDEHDITGLQFARALNGVAPKIILTNYPSVEAVRTALGPHLDGSRVAIAFASKKESTEKLLTKINLALATPNESLLRTMGAPTMQTLPDRIEALGPEAASERLRSVFDSERAELGERRALEVRRASDYHRASLISSGAAFLVVLVGIGLTWAGYVPPTPVTTFAWLAVNVATVLFCLRADKANQRLAENLKQSERDAEMGLVLQIIDTFETPETRDRNRQALFDRFLERIAERARTDKKGRGAKGA